VRACTSSNSRTFSIAITAWSAKVVTSSISLSLNGRTLVRDLPIGVPVLTIDRCHIRLAQAGRRLDQCVEHRLQVEGRAADDLEHVGGGGLLL
jgi:hypothetical protein